MRTGVARRAAAFQLAVKAGVAHRAAVFPLAVGAGVALRAVVFHLAVRAGVALHAAAFHLAVRAGVTLCAVAFQLDVRAGVAVRALAFQHAVREGCALRAVAFQLAVRAGVALRAPAFQLAVRAPVAHRAVAFQPAVGARVAVRALAFHLAVGARVALNTTSLFLPVRASSLPSRLVYHGITEIPRASACGYRIVATVRNACRWSGSVRKEHDTRALGHEVWFTRGSRIHSSFGSAFIAVVFSRYSRSVVHVKGQWVCRVPEWVGSVCRVAETPSRAWPVPRFPRRRRVGARVVAVCGTAARPGVPINTT